MGVDEEESPGSCALLRARMPCAQGPALRALPHLAGALCQPLPVGHLPNGAGAPSLECCGLHPACACHFVPLIERFPDARQQKLHETYRRW